MQINVRTISIVFASALFLLGCDNSSVQTKPALEPVFNSGNLYGDMQFKDGRISLDGYALSRREGAEKVFETCDAILAYPEEDTLPSEYYFYRQFSVECYAAKKFLEAGPASDSFLSGGLPAFFLKLPATATVRFGEAAPFEERQGVTIEQYFPGVAIKETSSDTVSAELDGADVNYTVIARGDLDNDGYEDIIVLVTYQLIEGAARGVNLFALSKPDENAAIDILWHYK